MAAMVGTAPLLEPGPEWHKRPSVRALSMRNMKRTVALVLDATM